MATRRYTLNVSKEVYAHLRDLSLKELRRGDKVPSVDDLLRKLLKIDKEKEREVSP